MTRASAVGGLRAAPPQCRELYSESVLLPRVALLALALALFVAAVVCVRRRHRRRVQAATFEVHKNGARLVSQPPDVSTTPARVSTVPATLDGRMRRHMKIAIVAGFVWTSLLILSFQSYNFMGSDSSSGPGRPRMVLSFTTMAKNIQKIRPTLEALTNQTGDGFDTIYVVVPREYRGEKTPIPDWLVAPRAPKNVSDFYGWKYTLSPSPLDPRIRVLVLDKDFGPGSKVLGALLVEQEPETIIVYGDDDRLYPPEFASRALYYTTKFPTEAVAVLGGWISAEDSFYCGRSLEIGINRVSFVGGAGGVVVRRRFYGHGFATTAAFAVTEMSKACFLGDDYYLSLVLSRNHVRRRVVYDSCWTLDNCIQAFGQEEGLSHAVSAHPGGPNVEHYQQCIRELGTENDLSIDAEFGQIYMLLFSRTWGLLRMALNLAAGRAVVAC